MDGCHAPIHEEDTDTLETIYFIQTPESTNRHITVQ